MSSFFWQYVSKVDSVTLEGGDHVQQSSYQAMS